MPTEIITKDKQTYRQGRRGLKMIANYTVTGKAWLKLRDDEEGAMVDVEGVNFPKRTIFIPAKAMIKHSKFSTLMESLGYLVYFGGADVFLDWMKQVQHQCSQQ